MTCDTVLIVQRLAPGGIETLSLRLAKSLPGHTVIVSLEGDASELRSAWAPLRDPALSGGMDFFIATDWRSGGKLALGMGRKAHVFVFSDDPRGLGDFNESAHFVGRDGMAVIPAVQLSAMMPMLNSYFTSLDPPTILRLRAAGGPGQERALVRGHGLTHGFPMAYPH